MSACHSGAGELFALTPIDLRAVTCDAYVVAGSTDHIIPWTGAYRTTQLLGGHTEFVLSTSGHIQAIVNPPPNARSSYLTRDGTPPPDPEQWRQSATRHRGSWWEHWTAWLSHRSGRQHPAAEAPGNDDYPQLEPAPGRYVYLQ